MSNTIRNSRSRKNKGLHIERILLIVLVSLLLAIAGGTAWKLYPGRSPDRTKNQSAQKITVPAEEGGERIWTGLGTLRVPIGTAKNENTQAVVVLAVGFPYDSGDKSFQEELALNVGKFREEIINYFASIDTGKNYQIPDEETIKTELLKRFNGFLRLSSIKTLYFSEFMILE